VKINEINYFGLFLQEGRLGLTFTKVAKKPRSKAGSECANLISLKIRQQLETPYTDSKSEGLLLLLINFR